MSVDGGKPGQQEPDISARGHFKVRRRRTSAGAISRCLQARSEQATRELVEDRIWALSEREVRYRALLDRQQDVISLRGQDGCLLFVNAAFCRTFAVDRADAVGSQFEPTVLAEPRRTGKIAPGHISLVETVNGPRWFHWSEASLPGKLPGSEDLQTVGRDITEQQAFEAKLAEARDAAEAANRAKSRFLAAMSHEIRTPLNGIMGLTRLLLDTQPTAEQRTFADGILNSADTLLALIQDILDFSKIEAGRLRINCEPFSLRDTIESAVALMAPKAEAKALSIDIVACNDVADVLIGDPLRIRQILLNLLDNAIKFTEVGGATVVVSGRDLADGRYALQVDVRDTGPGLSGLHMDQLFAEFEQATPDGPGSHDGAGLGLAIARRLAKAMHGDVVPVPQDNAGACFRLTLQLDQGATAPHQAACVTTMPVAAKDPPEANDRRVLIVEDNATSAFVVRMFLERMDVACDVAVDGASAVSAFNEAVASCAPFTSVLLDLRLPDMDGFQVLSELKAAKPAPALAPPTQFIALTAHAFAEDRRRCIAAGFDAYVAKPFAPDHLLRLVTAGV